MPIVAAVAGLALAAGMVSSVAPPTHSGTWHQLGAAVTSRPGKLLYFYRSADNPEALAAVFESSSSRAMRVSWSSYCEFSSDDDIMEEHQGTITGVGRGTIYAPVFAGATRCYLSINVKSLRAGKISAAIFAS